MANDVAATILPRSIVKVALDAQGMYTGQAGEHLESALGQWLARAGYPESFQKVSIDELALTAAAAPAGEVLHEIAMQQRANAGNYGGAARLWPTLGVPAPAPPAPRRPASALGSLTQPTTRDLLLVGAVALAGGVAIGAVGATMLKKSKAG